MKTDSTWSYLPKAGGIILVLAVLLGALSWMQPTHPVRTHRSQPEFRKSELVSSDHVTLQESQQAGKPCKRGGRHHGPPPPPPGIPPTVLFLIGGALGYLIGCQRKGPHCPPPPPPPPPRH